MAYVSSGQNQGLRRLPLVARLGEIFASAREARATYRVYRATRAELDGLSDRELADLGLSRETIPGVAWDAAQAAAETGRAR